MNVIKGLKSNPRRVLLFVLAACCAGAIAVGLPVGATSIPSWLDDAITKWNTANPETKIRFVDIKDSFVWYDMAKTSDLGHQEIRKRVNDIVLANGYAPMDDEELVTTGKPPATTSGRTTPKKCWSRSFVINIDAQGNTKSTGDESPGQRQRMLTSLVCEDTATWWAAFRVAG